MLTFQSTHSNAAANVAVNHKWLRPNGQGESGGPRLSPAFRRFPSPNSLARPAPSWLTCDLPQGAPLGVA
jgi:hypothetical protein